MAKRIPPTSAINFIVWAENGEPLAEEVVAALEEAMTQAILEQHFNQGNRLLTQTIHGR